MLVPRRVHSLKLTEKVPENRQGKRKVVSSSNKNHFKVRAVSCPGIRQCQMNSNVKVLFIFAYPRFQSIPKPQMDTGLVRRSC